AFGCVAGGSLPDRIEMKITLSTPSTISRNVSVTSASSPSEVRNASILVFRNFHHPDSAGDFVALEHDPIASRRPHRIADELTRAGERRHRVYVARRARDPGDIPHGVLLFGVSHTIVVRRPPV